MPVFYQGPQVRITHRAFRVLGPDGYSVDIKELQALYMIGDRQPAPHRGLWPLGVTSAAAVMTVAYGLMAEQRLEFAAAGALVLACSAFLASRPSAEVVHELWAVVEDRHMCLYRTADRTTFGQIQRALIRAREYAE